MDEEQIGNMAAGACTVWADQLEGLGRDLRDLTGEVSDQDAGELQPALVGHHSARCRGVIPARVVLPAAIPAELAYRDSAGDFVHRNTVELGLDQPPVALPVRGLDCPAICRGIVACTSPHGRPFVSDVFDTRTLAATSAGLSGTEDKPNERLDRRPPG
ncbi:hypothetical protein OG700_19700 [Streptomyces sp. NBC_01508]